MLTACAGYMHQNRENIQSISIRMQAVRLKSNSRKGWERKREKRKRKEKRKKKKTEEKKKRGSAQKEPFGPETVFLFG